MSEDPIQQKRDRLERELDGARDKIRDLKGELTFSDVVEALNKALAEAPETRRELERLRARGYAFRGDLERSLDQALIDSGPALAAVHAEIGRSESHLRAQARELSRDAGRITGDPIQEERRIKAIDSRVDGFEREIDALKERLEAHTLPVLKALREVRAKVKDLHWSLDQFDGASFSLQPRERPVAAAEATWTDGADAPKGLLLFTDHRVYFEQKEEKVTKRKFLFFTAEKEQLQRQLLDEPLGHLLDSQDSTKGMVFKDQLLTFTWSPQARCPSTTTFELESGDAAEWDAVVELIRAGDLDRDLADASSSAAAVPGSAPPPAAAYEARWPERCAGCGASLQAPVKGQTSIVCGYCATDHEVEFVEA